MHPTALQAISDRLIQLHARRDPDRGQVAIAGAGVAVTRGQPVAFARCDRVALRVAMAQVLGSTLQIDAGDIEDLVDRLVVLEETDGRATIRVCGSELVGLEDLTVATDRARSMREHLVSELQRALSDEPPVTRRSVPPNSVEAR